MFWPLQGHTRGHTSMSFDATIRKKSPRLSSFLYLKGRIFYYRKRVPKPFRDLGFPGEIRICLHTPYQNVAKRMVSYLHHLTSIALDCLDMKESCNDIQQRIQTLTATMREHVKSILSGEDKKIIGNKEIQNRIDLYLRQRLDEDSLSTELPPSAEIQVPGKPVEIITMGDAMRETAQKMKDDLTTGENYNEHFHTAILDLINAGVLNPSEISEENAQVIVKAYMIMRIKLYQILAARFDGDFALEKLLAPDTTNNSILKSSISDKEQVSQRSEIQTEHKPAIMLSDLIERYISTNINDGKWVTRTIPDHRNRISALLEICGDKRIDAITREDIRNFRNILKNLPPKWKEKMKKAGKTVEDFSKSNKGPTLTVSSINSSVEAVSTMFSWAIDEGLLAANPAKNLRLKDEQAVIEKKEPLSQEDINKVFFSGDYVPEKFKNPAYYWCPLISLYTGMRLEEAAQLHCEDIYKEDGIYIFDIKKESSDGLHDKILKTLNAKRKIPIHPKLIDLGLIKYLDDIIKLGEIRLFPKLNKTDKSPKYGKQVGKQFRSLLKKKISGTKSFHSLRHSFSNFFKKRNLHTDMFRQVFGHEISNLAGQVYGERFSPKEIYDELISKLDYGNET